MANRVKGQVALDTGDATYTLEFTPNGFCALEDETGKGTMEFIRNLEAAGEDLKISDMRLLIWAGLQEHHPDLSLRDAGTIIGELGGIEAAVELMETAVTAAFPDRPAKSKGGSGGKRKATA